MSQIIESAPRAFRHGIDSLKKRKVDKGIKRIESSLKNGFKPAMIFLDIYQSKNDIDQTITSFEALMNNGFSGASLAIGRLYYDCLLYTSDAADE